MRPSYRIGASSANWPQNDAFNNITTSKKLVRLIHRQR